MGQIRKQDEIGVITKASATSLSVAASRITVGGQQLKSDSPIVVDLSTTGANGLDTGALVADTLYYVYAINDADSLAFVASTSSSAPTGFDGYSFVGKFITKVTLAQVDRTSDDSLIEFAASDSGVWDSNDADTSNTIYGEDGAPITGALTAIRLKKVEFSTSHRPTDRLYFELFKVDRWVPSSTNVESDDYQKQNSTTYGVGFQINGSFGDAEVDVIFGQYSRANGAYAAAGDAWGIQTLRWRMVKVSQPL